MHYALAAHALPKKPLKKILVPTTAGTGSETSATTIFAGPEGKKLWIWGAETKADLVLLDPALTLTLPASLTAWCGLDAFVHAFEAATNRNAQAGAALYAHAALRLLTEALERAVKNPADIDARGKVLLGSCYAGIAIDNCGTAIAHNISHALAGLAPVHHGLATALGFEATLAWLAEADTAELAAAATTSYYMDQVGSDDPTFYFHRGKDLSRENGLLTCIYDTDIIGTPGPSTLVGVRTRHMRNTQANLLFADGHVEAKKKPDLKRTLFCVNPER